MSNKKFISKNGLYTNNIDFVDSVNQPDNKISIEMLDTDTLVVSGDSGVLVSINDSQVGDIFAVNGDITVAGEVDGRDVAADGAKLDDIEENSNNYIHPLYDGDDINTDTGTLSGASVIESVNISLTTDNTGHVVSASADTTTRDITYSDVGALSASATAVNSELLNSINSSQFVRSDEDDTINGDLLLYGGLSYEQNNAVHVIQPEGGMYSSTTPVSGCVKITLPVSWTDTMFMMEVDIYLNDGGSDGGSLKIQCGGFLDQTISGWKNVFANLLTGVPTNYHNVRFGHDGSKCVIYIGDTSTVWQYPQVSVSNVFAGFSGGDSDNWADGWDISVVSSFNDITQTKELENIASNSDMLDGNEGSYYLDYNNFTNKPYIPENTDDLTNNSGFITANDVIFESLDLNGDVGYGDTQLSVGSHTHDKYHDLAVCPLSAGSDIDPDGADINSTILTNSVNGPGDDNGTTFWYIETKWWKNHGSNDRAQLARPFNGNSRSLFMRHHHSSWSSWVRVSGDYLDDQPASYYLDYNNFTNTPSMIGSWSTITADTTASSGNGYFVDTSSNIVNITLPSNPTIGDVVAINDYGGDFSTNNCIVNRNGEKIMELDENFYADYDNLSLTFTYVDTLKGWRITNSADGSGDSIGDLIAAIDLINGENI